MNRCRNCGQTDHPVLLHLGQLPLANSFLQAPGKVRTYPLNLFYCHQCRLLQLEDTEKPENIFGEDFKYFSSYSGSLLEHSRDYCAMIIQRLALPLEASIVEIASNDGYLLHFFRQQGFSRILGIEPAASVASEAIRQGIPTEIDFFNLQTAERISRVQQADLLIANNVIAHVPDIQQFVAGMEKLLKNSGTVTVEFQHSLALLQNNYFDMIYHEHFSYLSLYNLQEIMAGNGMVVYDAEKISAQGGSLRVYAAKQATGRTASSHVQRILAEEAAFGLGEEDTYRKFAAKTREIKKTAQAFFADLKKAGKSIAAYGAAAKGSTFLNYLGIDDAVIDFVVDKNPEKQGLYMAGSNLRVYPPEELQRAKPEYIVILPWNIKDEIMAEHSYVRAWGGKFVVLMPELREY